MAATWPCSRMRVPATSARTAQPPFHASEVGPGQAMVKSVVFCWATTTSNPPLPRIRDAPSDKDGRSTGGRTASTASHSTSGADSARPNRPSLTSTPPSKLTAFCARVSAASENWNVASPPDIRPSISIATPTSSNQVSSPTCSRLAGKSKVPLNLRPPSGTTETAKSAVDTATCH